MANCYSTIIHSVPQQYRITGGTAREIAASVERGVESGNLAPGAPLPSVRALAAELGVSPTTVAAALSDLRRRGLTMTKPGSGTRVSWRPSVGGGGAAIPVPAGARDLASGNPDPDLLPDLGAALRGLRAPRQLYGGEEVLPDLARLAREELAGAGIDAAELAIASGALDGIERALQARLGPGQAIAVEDPGFAGLFDLLRANGYVLRPVAIDRRGMLPEALGEALADGVAAVVINPRGQNPTGAALDGPRAEELRAVLGRWPEAMVVEDDHLGPIAGAPRHTLTPGRERWVAARSLAKALGPDLRLAYLAGDAQTMRRVRARQAVGPQWVSHILQQLAIALCTEASVDAVVRRATSAYASRRARLLGALGERGIEALGATGIAVWVPVPDEAAACQALLASGWAVAPGGPFRLRSGPGVRITISTLAEGEPERLAGALAGALRPAGRTRTA